MKGNRRDLDAWREGGGYNRGPSMYRGGYMNPYRVFDRMFDEFMAPWSGGRGGFFDEGRFDFSPPVDVEETENHYLLSFDLPGVKKDDLRIDVDGNTLTVSGERKEEHEEKGKTRYSFERSYGRFERSFTLPTSVDADQIEAAYEDGVLKVAVPKLEASKAKRVAIGERKPGGFWEKFKGLTKDVGAEKKDVETKGKSVA